MKSIKWLVLVLVTLLVSTSSYSVGDNWQQCIWGDASCDASMEHLWGSSTGGWEHLWETSDADRWERLWPGYPQAASKLWSQSFEDDACDEEQGIPTAGVAETGSDYLLCNETTDPTDLNEHLWIKQALTAHYVHNTGNAVDFSGQGDAVFLEMDFQALGGPGSPGTKVLFLVTDGGVSDLYPRIAWHRSGLGEAFDVLYLQCGAGDDVTMNGFTRGTWYTIQVDIDQSDTSTQKMRVYIESSGNQHGDEVSCDSDQANPIEGNKWGVVVASLGGAHYVDNLQLSTEAFDAP